MEWKNAIKGEDNRYHVPKRWLFLHYYEALNLLFRIENALRVFVYLVLKNNFKEKWAEIQITNEDGNEGTINSIAKRRTGQSESFGYLGYSIVCPIMHLTSGELTRLIISEAYWKLFKDYFLGGKDIIKNKLEEIGSIRNSLAHFRPIKSDDVDVIKQNSKHVLLGIERFLSQALVQPDIIPTNTTDVWYGELRTLGTDHCVISFNQSKDEQWVRLSMEYKCPLLKMSSGWGHYIRYNLLTIKSSAILSGYQALNRDVTFLSEQVPWVSMVDDYKPLFRKIVAMGFSRKMISEQYAEIKTDLNKLLLDIAKETELIQKDNLARGNLVHSISTGASGEEKEGKVSWRVYTEALKTPVSDSDPPEYWGDLNISGWDDFVAGTQRYPWMPDVVSEFEMPF